MAALRRLELRISQERGFADGQSISSHQHAVARDPAQENSGPLPTSKVFAGMLRTTTETGDIGIFSIKPSRISQPLNGPRRIYHPPQPLFRHFQSRDDRRNLPSYTHNASSEIQSTHDNASQRSVSQYSTVQDTNQHPYRSYSAACSSSTVSNRRPYATIANQTGLNGSSQRPSSPSTSRVMRPPRPLLPVLVDGDGTGNLPSTEAERLLYVSLSYHAVTVFCPCEGLINSTFVGT
jgi:hypothetical protein